ncbi:hypothetical protein OG241_23430 [Streptomyces sp. NBC_01390]|uniref:hypothetical protein n=1 Tax=Streptomyces sp. NBC_01390 TaxID=2903850 RepID=UPI00324573BA
MAVRDVDPAPKTMLRGRGGTARLQDETVMLDRAGIRLIIPLDAIRTVLVDRNKRTTAEILLNSAVAGAGAKASARDRARALAESTTVCAISSRSTEAVEAFAHAVNAAIPQRDEAERRIDGAALVKAEKRPSTSGRPRRPYLSTGQWWAVSTLTCLFTLGLLFPVSADDGRLTQLWVALFPVVVSCCVIAYGTWRATVTWWLLHRYGVTTVAHNVGYKPTDYEDDPGVTVYSFTDTGGTSHTFDRAAPRWAFDMRIAYDPARPDFARGPAHPWTRTLILLIRLLLGVPITLALVAYLLWYFTVATHPEIGLNTPWPSYGPSWPMTRAGS